MSLRTKIALGVLVIPAVMAVVLLVLIVLGVRNEARRIQNTNNTNAQRLANYHNQLGEELDRAWLLVTKNWVDGNLSIHHYREDRERELFRRLRDAAIFRSVAVIPLAPSGIVHPSEAGLLVKYPGQGESGPQPWQIDETEERLLARLNNASALAHRNIIYRRYHYFDADRSEPTLESRPDLLLRLEMVAKPSTPPAPELASLDLSPIVEAAMWTVALAALAMTFVTTWAVRRFVLTPLDSLVQASRSVAAGDFSHQLDETGAGKDEMGELLRAFNLMQARIEEYQLDMENKVHDASQRIREHERSLIVAQRLAATGTLAAGLAHEINNPLGGMLNALRRIREKTTDSSQREYLDLMEEGLGRIKTLMGQILNFSRGRDAPAADFDVVEALTKAVEFVRYRFDETHRLSIELPKVLSKVFGDPGAIGQVMINLLLNARDALSDSGEVKLLAREERGDIVIEVKDTGHGMDEQTRAHIFDPFFTTKGPGKGTGLGLTIVHTIVSNHDGVIAVDSEPGKGTAFTIRIPVSRKNQEREMA
ncbi:MAG: HAMP domain-containing histidine kinase [Planctomycetaceae bacterium]|nr:HAMP domain-containing histidine kinase [Planctomycetaceae bacterium]